MTNAALLKATFPNGIELDADGSVYVKARLQGRRNYEWFFFCSVNQQNLAEVIAKKDGWPWACMFSLPTNP